MASLVRFQGLLGVEALLTGGAVEQRVNTLLVAFESSVTATRKVTFRAGERVLEPVDAFGMVP